MKTRARNDNPVDSTLKDGERTARKIAFSDYVEDLARLGYAARGLIYFVMGLLAFQVLIGAQGAPADQQGAIAYIGRLTFGRFLLALVVIGLIGYSLWGVIRAVFDPLHKGNDMKGLATRAGYLFSAVSYAALVIPTYAFITGGARAAHQGAQTAQTQHTTATLLSHSWGPWVVGIIGIAGVLGGLYQVFQAFQNDFERYYRPWGLNPEQARWVDRMGRFGTGARGVVFGLVGLFLVQAALHADPSRAQGIDGALLSLLRQPYGPWLLGIVAIGLIAFGVYSFLGAVWFRMQKA